jgi:hypothetical protein
VRASTKDNQGSQPSEQRHVKMKTIQDREKTRGERTPTGLVEVEAKMQEGLKGPPSVPIFKRQLRHPFQLQRKLSKRTIPDRYASL